MAEENRAAPGDNLHLTTSTKRIPELDGLRGLAILMVVTCHYIGASNTVHFGVWTRRLCRFTSIGWSGVDLFFVLSGFLIGGILLESRNFPRYFNTFYLRRTHRILPIYYLWLIIFAGFVWLSVAINPQSLIQTDNLRHLPYYLTFLQNYLLYKAPIEFVLLGATWSLAVEEQFYLCTPLLIRFLNQRTLVAVLVTVVLLAPVLRLVICLVYPNYFTLVSSATPCRADDLACGVLAAVAFQYAEFRQFLRQHPKFLANSLLILFFCLVLLGYWFFKPVSTVAVTVGYTCLGFFFLCLLLFVLSSTGSGLAGIMRSKVLRNFGMISYCVYIIHYPVLAGVHALLLRAQPDISDWKGAGATLFAALLTWSLAMLSWYYFEKPLVRRGHQFTY